MPEGSALFHGIATETGPDPSCHGRSPPAGLGSKIATSLAAGLDSRSCVEPLGQHWRAVVPSKIPGQWLSVVIPHKRFESPTTYIFLLWMLGMTVLWVGAALWVMRNQMRSILELVAVADRVGRGEAIGPIAPSGPREIRRVFRAFLRMRDRLQRQFEQRSFLLSGVAHDLRTPLTRLTLQIAMMDDNEETKNLRRDAKVMQSIIHDYLDFARYQVTESLEEIALEDWVAWWLHPYPQVERMASPACRVKIRATAMGRAMVNMVENALRHGSRCAVHWAIEPGGWWVLYVEDNGPGIEPEERERIFQLFYQGDNQARTMVSGSPTQRLGLGLAMVREVVQSHGGRCSVETGKCLGGACFVVRLPVVISG
jgi:two-component system osmolarity sensor histidine kinase EnvZ